MPSKDKNSNNDKKRKYTSPKENPTKVTRRRLLSSSLPELNLIDNTYNQLAELKMKDKTGSTSTPPPQISLYDPQQLSPLVHQNYKLPTLIYSNPSFKLRVKPTVYQNSSLNLCVTKLHRTTCTRVGNCNRSLYRNCSPICFSKAKLHYSGTS